MAELSVTEQDLREIAQVFAQHPGCRVLQIVTGTNSRLALDVALHDDYIARIDAPNLVKTALGEIADFDAYLESLRDRPPTVAITYYSKPVEMAIAADDVSSESFKRRDRFMKLRKLHSFLATLGIPIFMECGDLHSRVGSEHFYDEIRSCRPYGLIMNNRAAIAIVEEELVERGIDSVKTILWQPLGIDPDLHRDYGLEKQRNFVMYGRTDEAFRQRLLKFCRRRQLLTLGRFGFRHLRRNTIEGDSLFVEVHRSRAAFAAHQSGGVYKGRPIGMTYAKYFEIPGCRTLLVGQPTPDLAHLGLVEDEHYIAVTPDNYRHVLPRLARDIASPRLQAITDRAFTLVHERHRIGQQINRTLRAVVGVSVGSTTVPPSPMVTPA